MTGRVCILVTCRGQSRSPCVRSKQSKGCLRRSDAITRKRDGATTRGTPRTLERTKTPSRSLDLCTQAEHPPIAGNAENTDNDCYVVRRKEQIRVNKTTCPQAISKCMRGVYRGGHLPPFFKPTPRAPAMQNMIYTSNFRGISHRTRPVHLLGRCTLPACGIALPGPPSSPLPAAGRSPPRARLCPCSCRRTFLRPACPRIPSPWRCGTGTAGERGCPPSRPFKIRGTKGGREDC